MLSENQLLNHIYQTAEMGQEGIQSVLKYTEEPRLVSALNSQLIISEEAFATGPSPFGGSPRAWSMDPAALCSFSYSVS